jgi:hypothetical protein
MTNNKLCRFKLLLRPGGATTTENIPHPKLPASKTIIDVYADFYRYLYERAQQYIKESNTALGELVWNSLGSNIEFVLSHPNGWEGAQQSAMRRAAIKAGLVPDTPAGSNRISFVTEGEASLDYCIANGLISEKVKASANSTLLVVG